MVREEAKVEFLADSGTHQYNDDNSKRAYGKPWTTDDHCGAGDADAGDLHVDHTQRPDVVQGHRAGSKRRRIEATAPPAALPAKGAGKDTIAPAAPTSSKQPPPVGNTAGGKTALGAVPAEKGARDGELDVVPSGARDMHRQMAERIGALLVHQMGLLGDEVRSLGDEVRSLGGKVRSLGGEVRSLGGEVRSLRDQVKSLSSRMDAVEARVGVGHAAQN